MQTGSGLMVPPGYLMSKKLRLVGVKAKNKNFVTQSIFMIERVILIND